MRARLIKPGFFTNDELAECSPHARLLFIGLWCLADREGRQVNKPRRIKASVLPFDEVDISQLLAELEAHGFVQTYVVDGLPLLQINNFGRHQHPHFKEVGSEFPPPPDAPKTPPVIHTQETPQADASKLAMECQSGVPISMHESSMAHESVIKDDPARRYLYTDTDTDTDTEERDKPPVGGSSSARRVPAAPLALVGKKPRENPPGDPSTADAEPPPPQQQQAEPEPSAEPAPPSLVEADPPSPAGLPGCPHLQVLALWAEVLPDMPQHLPGLWHGPRAAHLRARWRETAKAEGWTSREQGLEWFRRLFAWVGRSAFLTGRTPTRGDRTPFHIELEWLVKPTNWAKVIEGKYHPEAAA